MAHFAKIQDGLVTSVIVVNNRELTGEDGVEVESLGQAFLSRSGFEGVWLQTSYNTLEGKHVLGGTPFRGNYAGVGYTYDETLDAFLPPKPYASWTLNEATYSWEAPVVMPDDGGRYVWVEELGDWVAVPEPTE